MAFVVLSASFGMNPVRLGVLLSVGLPMLQLLGAETASGKLPPIPPPHVVRPSAVSAGTPRSPVTVSAGISTNRLSLAPPAGIQPGKPGVLAFDATSKHVELNEDERKAAFVFAVTNVSSDEVTISYINTSCGCTAGKLPSTPWVLKSGEGGHIDVTVDATGKIGRVTKTATLVASTGSYPLTVSVSIPTPAPNAMNRSKNLQVASADRQAVFRNDCAACHVQPTYGKAGRELYDAACGICHEAEHRASMVPDLRTRLKHTDRNYWAKWISDGRVGSLMPAFSGRNGGILTDQQIASLVDYLEDDYKRSPPPSKTVIDPVPSSTSSKP